MDDDFNTPLAISVLFDIAGAVNSYAENSSEIETSARSEVSGIFNGLLGVLGIEVSAEKHRLEETSRVKGLMDLVVDLRQEMRGRKDWGAADNLRDRLLELGFVIEDAPDGTRWRARKPT